VSFFFEKVENRIRRKDDNLSRMQILRVCPYVDAQLNFQSMDGNTPIGRYSLIFAPASNREGGNRRRHRVPPRHFHFYCGVERQQSAAFLDIDLHQSCCSLYSGSYNAMTSACETFTDPQLTALRHMPDNKIMRDGMTPVAPKPEGPEASTLRPDQLHRSGLNMALRFNSLEVEDYACSNITVFEAFDDLVDC